MPTALKGAEAPALDLAAIKAFFTESLDEQMAPLREELAAVKAQLAEVDRQVPKFIKMPRRDNPSGMPKTPAEHLATMAQMTPGDTTSRSIHSTLVTQNGKRMDQGALAALLENYAPLYGPGDAVRINPAAERLGWTPGKTWAELLAKSPSNPDGYGEVQEVCPFSHRGWMYRVVVKGHSEKPSGMVFDQHELLSA